MERLSGISEEVSSMQEQDALTEMVPTLCALEIIAICAMAATACVSCLGGYFYVPFQ